MRQHLRRLVAALGALALAGLVAACTPDVMGIANQIADTAQQLNQQHVLSDAQTAPIMIGVAHAHDVGRQVVAAYDAYKAADAAAKAATQSQLDRQLADLSSAFAAIDAPATAGKILALIQQALHDIVSWRAQLAAQGA